MLSVALARAARTLLLAYLGRGSEPMCPFCGAKRIRESGTLLISDRLYRLLGFFPYRCRGCYARFYRFTPFRRPLPQQHQT